MDRRDFLKALPALAVVPMAASARSAFAGVKMKITDLRLVTLRVERPLGSLVDFITSGPVLALAVSGESAISVVRTMMGATDPLDSAPGTIRGDFALEGIRAPTLVVHARDDTFVAFAHGEYTARHIPNARLASFDSGGHFVIVRDAAAAEIVTFLRQVGK